MIRALFSAYRKKGGVYIGIGAEYKNDHAPSLPLPGDEGAYP